MNNEEVLKKYGIRKRIGVMIGIQVLLVIAALVLTIFGIIRSTDSWNRVVVYLGQALACVAIIIFGLVGFKKIDIRNFRMIINSYALLEAIRVSLINLNGIKDVYAILIKLVLVIITCNCVLFAERLDKKSSIYISYSLIILETILYILFWLGVPAVGTRVLYTFLPFVGILIASSLCLFNKARIEQENNTKKYNNKTAGLY